MKNFIGKGFFKGISTQCSLNISENKKTVGKLAFCTSLSTVFCFIITFFLVFRIQVVVFQYVYGLLRDFLLFLLEFVLSLECLP